MKYCLVAIFSFTSCFAIAQNRNSVWCFGDSAGIDFKTGIPTPITSVVNSRGSCASISDTLGNLLFYVSYDPDVIIAGTDPVKAYSLNGNIMINGDSMKGGGCYQEIIIVPYPNSDSLYYIFYIGVVLDYGLYYSVVDMRADSGMGAVIQKNIQLQSFEQVDCISAIKHGNGIDWWILSRKSDAFVFGSNNNWYRNFISPNGVQSTPIQSIGSQNRTNEGRICFSSFGDKLIFTNLNGVLELFDFDRCTGLLSNPITIEQDQGVPPFPFLWSCAFSPDATKLYVTASPDSTYLFQYDLTASNIAASRDTLWSINYPLYAGGALKLAPDNKIYLSTIYYNGSSFPYPYPPGVYNMYNMNLGVINSPDSLGAACNFLPWSFNLGGKRTYTGLPNNPDYELPRDSGSICDTLVWTNLIHNPNTIVKGELYLTYINSWDKLFINAQHLRGNTYMLSVTDLMGRLVFSEQGKLQPPYFTKDLNCAAFAKGMYVVTLTTDKEQVSRKFIKN